MLRCAGPPNKECPFNAKLNECQVGFGDDMFCKPCMKQQREYRNSAQREQRNGSQGPQAANATGHNDSEDIEPLTGITNGTIGNVIVQPLLAYIVFALQSGTVSNIKNAIIGHFTLDQIIQAKETLWAHCGNDIIGEKQTRKDSTARSAKEAHVTDILSAWTKLDRADATPPVLINALSLSVIPRSHPEELHSISVIDRLNQMEQRMDNMAELLDRTVAENLVLKDTIQKKPQPNTYSGVVKGDMNSAGKTMGARPKDTKHVVGNTNTVSDSVQTNSEQTPEQCVAGNDNQDTDIDQYEIPSYHRKRAQRMRKRQQVVMGTASPSGTSVKGAPHPGREFFIFRLDKSTSAEQLM